jgi:signal transduction histidine kinase
LGYSNLAKKHPERREEMLNAISRNATRLQKLTDDILDVTRIESQTLKLNKEKFNLNDVISYIIEDFRNDIEKEQHANIELIYEARKNNNNHHYHLLVEADKARITQVISNLLSNAIRHTKKRGGAISVTTSVQRQKKENDENNKGIVVSVKDTGDGIDTDIIPRLFTKFATKSEQGIGLGLYISKSIIEAHRGKIWAENNKDGERGATFYFSIPVSG